MQRRRIEMLLALLITLIMAGACPLIDGEMVGGEDDDPVLDDDAAAGDDDDAPGDDDDDTDGPPGAADDDEGWESGCGCDQDGRTRGGLLALAALGLLAAARRITACR